MCHVHDSITAAVRAHWQSGVGYLDLIRKPFMYYVWITKHKAYDTVNILGLRYGLHFSLNAHAFSI